MEIRTCLLISEDCDDQLEFSEALYEISSDTIMITVTHARKAMDLLQRKVHLPDFIFLDLSINEIHPDVFLTALKSDSDLEKIPIIAYGDYSEFDQVTTEGITAFLERDYSYSDLRVFLMKVINKG